jgi:hypothetical protein
MRTRWAAIGAAVAVSIGGGAVFVANAATTTAEEFRAIEPCRLLDTRSGTSQLGMWSGRIGPTAPLTGDTAADQRDKNDLTVVFDPDASTITTNISGGTTPKPLMGNCSALVGASGEILSGVDPVAVVLNVTVLNSSASSFVTVYPWEYMAGNYTTDKADRRPFISQLNPIPSHGPITNAVTVELVNTVDGTSITGASCNSAANKCTGLRAFRIYNDQGLTDVFVDVVGYYHVTGS